MGKRKQKVRWCTVDGLHWSTGDQAETSPEGSAGVVKGEAGTGSGSGGIRRSSAQGWTSSLAPRFERKAAAEAEQKHIYYEGEFCEAEDLPNGFTKIRSKNLDILFKRDYYEQRLAAQQLLADELKNLKQSEATEDVEEGQEEKQDKETENKPTNENMDNSDSTAKSSSWSFDKINPNEIPEFKPMESGMETLACDIDSGHNSPFYGSYPPFNPQEYPAGHQYDAPHRPNLYLYSPTNNTLIPCEEIIIPNPVMSPDGPVYSGPTNIYLAYPVQGPDGRGYITQPFAPPGSAGSYMSQDSASYSPSMSYDGSNCYSSTPHTHNSGQDSGSSTQPASPPPLVNYHPNNWINQDQQSLNPNARDMYYSNPLPPHTEGYYNPQKDEPSHLNPPQSVPTNSAAAPVSTAPSTNVPYIPGLPQDSMGNTPKKSQKRRKKKKKVDSFLEHRGSTSSESEIQKSETFGECDNSESNNDEIISGQTFEVFVPEATAEPIHEIHLTDDLADSLVNPPTDPEGSDDEVSHQSSAILVNDPPVEESEDKINSSLETNLAVNTTTNNNEATNKLKFDEIELEDKEVSEITENMKVQVASESKSALINVVPVNNCVETSEMKSIANIVNSETIEIESDENIIKCTNLLEDPVKDLLEKGESFDKIVETECTMKVEECEIGKNEVAQTVPEKENPKKKLRNRKPKKDLKLVLKSGDENKVEMSKSKDQIITQRSKSPAEIKKSYSSVIKANLVKETNNNLTISSQPKVETVPISSPLPTNSNSPSVQRRTEEESENWKKVPLSVTKPENWEKTSKKRKNKNKHIKFEDSPLPEEMPDLEVVDTPMEANKVVSKEKSSTPMEVTQVVLKEADPEEENTKDDEIEQEKKKLRKRKKKYGSEDPEDSTRSHRVLICDEQIDIRYSRAVRRASEVLSPSLLDTVKTSGYCDFLLVNELGSGISRGCMNFGRLYQGKYVPPERIDGLLPECEEEECIEEEAGVEVTGEDSCITATEDIDLD